MADVDIKSTSANTVDVLGLDDVKADVKGDFKLQLPQPLKTETASELTVQPLRADLGATNHVEIDPLKTDSSLAVDLKPAVVDLCLTVNVGKLPNVHVRQPYHHHIGFTLWGTEVWGYTFSGEQETMIQEQQPEPRIALGRPQAAWRARDRASEPPTRETGGLRIRLGP
jgi:hypothetical protein